MTALIDQLAPHNFAAIAASVVASGHSCTSADVAYARQYFIDSAKNKPLGAEPNHRAYIALVDYLTRQPKPKVTPTTQAKDLLTAARHGNISTPAPWDEPAEPPTANANAAKFDRLRQQKRRADGLEDKPQKRFTDPFQAIKTRSAEADQNAKRRDIERTDKRIEAASAEPAPTPPATGHTIPIHFDIARALFKNDATVAGIVWIIVHDHINRQRGRQLITRREFADLFCDQLGMFSTRHANNVINAGLDVFWTPADDDRLFIYGLTDVADSLDIDRLASGARVDVPLSALSSKLNKRRAALWSAVYGENKDARPMSRATLEDLTGIPRATQHRYERDYGYVKTTRNYEILEDWDTDRAREIMLAHSGSVFRFIDRKGRHGRPDAMYIARHMPNTTRPTFAPSYYGCTRKRVNRRLKMRVNSCNAPMFNDVDRLYAETLSEAKRTSAESFRVPVTARNGSQFWQHVL